MTGIISVAIMAILTAVAGYNLRRGRGSWMIAGYNTMTPEEKSKYDREKLCRYMGNFMYGVTGFLAAVGALCALIELELLPESTAGGISAVISVAFAVAIVWFCIFINKSCRK